MCKDFTAALPKTKITGNAIEFEIENSKASPQAVLLENCSVTGEISDKAFSSAQINQISVKWGGFTTIVAPVKLQSNLDANQKSYGIAIETLRKSLPGIWTMQNAEGSCLNLEFKLNGTSLQYRFFRSELSSCKTPPANLEYKEVVLHSLESEIPNQLRSKIQANNFLLQFRRIGDSSTWSMMTLDGLKLLKLGNNIVDPLQLLDSSSADTYLQK